MSVPRETLRKLQTLGPHVVSHALARAALGDWETSKALLPYILPKAARASMPISTAVEIDISTTAAAKASMARIATAIGKQEIGMEEGILLMDVVGRALERMSVIDVQDLTLQLEAIEKEKTAPVASSRQPISHANGSTPRWGNIAHHHSLKSSDE
jgi:hypothetical protein